MPAIDLSLSCSVHDSLTHILACWINMFEWFHFGLHTDLSASPDSVETCHFPSAFSILLLFGTFIIASQYMQTAGLYKFPTVLTLPHCKLLITKLSMLTLCSDVNSSSFSLPSDYVFLNRFSYFGRWGDVISGCWTCSHEVVCLFHCLSFCSALSKHKNIIGETGLHIGYECTQCRLWSTGVMRFSAGLIWICLRHFTPPQISSKPSCPPDSRTVAVVKMTADKSCTKLFIGSSVGGDRFRHTW